MNPAVLIIVLLCSWTFRLSSGIPIPVRLPHVRVAIKRFVQAWMMALRSPRHAVPRHDADAEHACDAAKYECDNAPSREAVIR